MASDASRDDFIIAIRSAFLKKGTRQKFSLFTLLIISILVLSLEYFKSGPVNTFRSITKDVIFKASFFISSPFVYIKSNYYYFKDHLQMYEEYTDLKKKNYSLESLRNENEFYKSENIRLKKLIDEKHVYSNEFLLSKVLLDKQSPYLKSVIINKGFNHGIKLGVAVKEKYYFVGKIINVNFLTSRILLASDLNSKIPVIIEPNGVNAILSGQGHNDYAELEFLPKLKKIKEGDIVYTSGIDGIIPQAIPIGKVYAEGANLFVEFFVDFNQLKYVKVNK
jgi:rod shape-determining protein MreC